MTNFASWFLKITAKQPFPYQEHLATLLELPQMLNIPTGAGKTAAVVLAWLWRRRFHPDQTIRQNTPRRLVYCLPMRTLVEQTYAGVKNWLCEAKLSPEVQLNLLMGGAVDNRWDIHPEGDRILIGTQDQLLSRALNRGYGMSRYRWPVHFALLNNDCLWVMDEVQLMGIGFLTTAQLQGFRSEFGTYGRVSSLWMSATLDRELLQTVNYQPDFTLCHQLTANDKVHPTLQQRMQSRKRLKKAFPIVVGCEKDYAKKLAASIVCAHTDGTLTLVICNRVTRAQAVYLELLQHLDSHPDKNNDKTSKNNFQTSKNKSSNSGVTAVQLSLFDTNELFNTNEKQTKVNELLLIHSRFRPQERQSLNQKLHAIKDGICVATPVVEAGVDISAQILFTELSQWASLVQRFGRCNRYGECSDTATVYWIDIDFDCQNTASTDENQANNSESNQAIGDDGNKGTSTKESKAASANESNVISTNKKKAATGKKNQATSAKVNNRLASPYTLSDLKEAKALLETLTDVGPQTLSSIRAKPKYPSGLIPRKHDLLQLFDTSTDLAGHDIDISPFIRQNEDTDVAIAWRNWDGNKPTGSAAGALRCEELCRVSLYRAKEFLNNRFLNQYAWEWSGFHGEWVKAVAIYPGIELLLHCSTGGYSDTLGFTGDPKHKPSPIEAPVIEPDRDDADALATQHVKYVTLKDHSQDVAFEVQQMCTELTEYDLPVSLLSRAGRWHDQGKAHPVFQKMMTSDRRELVSAELWAKSAQKTQIQGQRRGFRHELVSALVALQLGEDFLLVYLIAAHHGKVRMTIQPRPNENKPPELLSSEVEVTDTQDAIAQKILPKAMASSPSPQFPRSSASRKYALGVWEGDEVPMVDLGDGLVIPSQILNLDCMALGDGFHGESWSAQALTLLEKYGPFKLAYLETIVRVADWRVSARYSADILGRTDA